MVQAPVPTGHPPRTAERASRIARQRNLALLPMGPLPRITHPAPRIAGHGPRIDVGQTRATHRGSRATHRAALAMGHGQGIPPHGPRATIRGHTFGERGGRAAGASLTGRGRAQKKPRARRGERAGQGGPIPRAGAQSTRRRDRPNIAKRQHENWARPIPRPRTNPARGQWLF